MITVDYLLRQTNVPGPWMPVLEKASVMTPKCSLEVTSDGGGEHNAPAPQHCTHGLQQAPGERKISKGLACCPQV